MSQPSFDLKKVKVPSARDRVNKEDCAFCFKDIDSEGGLFVDLYTFIGFCRDHAPLNFERTRDSVYLNIQRTKSLKRTEQKEGAENQPPKKKPVVFAIGVEGGFDPEDEAKWEHHYAYSVVSLPSFQAAAWPDANLPLLLQQSVEAVIKADTASKKDEVKAFELTEKPVPSKYSASLKQLDNGVRIPRTGWKCSKCDLTENLWMNLTDGTILCGRRNFDGSGGNNHAVEYYQQTGYPLAVKLGTITPTGTADVYSYPEDVMVDDPQLRQHLAHFGIAMESMEKTDKTLAEMNVDFNNNYDWARIQEAGKELTPLFGPGCTGLRNLGNSCYMASVMQVLFSIPAFQQRYYARAQELFKAAPSDPTQDLATQMAKLADGLLSGKFSQAPAAAARPGDAASAQQAGIAPKMFKAVVGKGHPEFSTNRQQDALEFYQHLLTLLERAERGQADPSRVFKFKLEERTECSASHMVKYGTRLDNSASLPIPVERATNLAEYQAYEAKVKALAAKGEKPDPKESPVRPHVPLAACLEAFAAPEIVSGFYSTAMHQRVNAIKSTRFATFPEVLCLHMRKFVLDGWVPKKLDVLVEAPDDLDLSQYRAKGLQPGERELPASDGPAAGAPAAPRANEGIVAALTDMGFPRNRAEKAALATANASADHAMSWLLEHMDDADIDAPPAAPAAAAPAPAPAAAAAPDNEEGIAVLMSMGFTHDQAVKALRATGQNVERATDWIFSHADELEKMDVSGPAAPAAAPAAAGGPAADGLSDGPGRYKLFAFVSHMGGSTHSGHYVCHILKDGKWIMFNDQKVAESADLPRELAYLYFYRRQS